MFYAILGIVVVVALILIFRDDHDDSYNKSEKGQQKARQTRSAQAVIRSDGKLLGSEHCTLIWEQGNHFNDNEGRLARAFAWCMERIGGR